MKFNIDENKKLYLFKNNEKVLVDLVSCFPISNSNQYISVRNIDGIELGMINSIDELDNESKDAVKSWLNFKNFIFKVSKFYQINEDFGLRHFVVETNCGQRSFQTALDYWPQLLEDGSYLIEDLHGEYYSVEDISVGKKLIDAYL